MIMAMRKPTRSFVNSSVTVDCKHTRREKNVVHSVITTNWPDPTWEAQLIHMHYILSDRRETLQLVETRPRGEIVYPQGPARFDSP